MGRLVGIGRSVVVVGHLDVLGESEHSHEGDAGQCGGARAPRTSAQTVDHRQDGGKHRQVGSDKHYQPRPETFEKHGVQIGRKRTIETIGVPIQHGTVGQSPGKVKFATEINQRIRPSAP